MVRNEIDKLDSKLSLLGWRLEDLRRERERLEITLKRKRLKPETWASLEARLASINDQIKALQREESDVDDERYDRLYGWRR
jgi:hypothetical protein